MQVHGTTDNSSVTANCPALLLNADGSLNTGTGTTAGQVQGNTASGVTDAGNPVKVGGVYNSTPPTLTTGQRADLQTDSRGTLHVGLYDASGNSFSTVAAPLDGLSNSATSIPVFARNYVFNGTTWDRVTKTNSASRIVSAAASTNATSAKASAGALKSISGYNAAAAVRYLKIYNKASAPTVGTDTPILTLALKPTDTFNFSWPDGFYFATGIAYALTVGSADSDTAALTAADVVGLNVSYS